MTSGSDYNEASDAALKRDRHTCQLCGIVGYPKTERGLAAVSVEPDDHRIENLVTVCHECLKKGDRQLEQEVREAFERRRRRTPNVPEESQLDQEDSESASRYSVINRLRSTGRYLTTPLQSIFNSGSDSVRDEMYRQVDKVGQKDNHCCQVCGKITRPRGRLGYVMWPFQEIGDEDPEVDDLVSVCFDCLDWQEEDVIEHETHRAGRLKNAQRGPSILYAKSIFREFKEKTRLFAHSGQLVVLRRTLTTAVGLIGLLVSGALLAGLLGALFVSPQSGISWAQTALDTYRTAGTALLTSPWTALGALGIGYMVHVYEQERAYERELFRDERRRGETSSVGHARPRWQFVAEFSAVGLFGAVDWMLVRHGVFPDGMLFGALVFWSVGSAGVAFYLRKALREDRDIHGQPVNPAPWVFASRYALFVALAGAAAFYLTTTSLFPPAILESTLIAAPLVGALYVGRRLAEQRTVWGARTMYSIRSVIDRVWSLDDDWPPTEQNQKRANPDDADAKNG